MSYTSPKFASFTLLCLTIYALNIYGQEKPIVSLTQQAALSKAKEDYRQGNYPESMKGALSVYEIAVNTDDRPTIADAGNLIGLVDLAQGHAKAAVNYFKKALQINRSLNNNQRTAANLLNISLAQAELNQLDSAVIYVRESLRISLAGDLKNLIAMGRNHLGNYYFKQNKPGAAETEFKSVLQDKNYQSNWENSFACTGMAKIHFSKKQFGQAARYADQAYTLALAADAKWDAARALELAHKAYREIGDSQKAYDRLLAFKTYNDSLFSASKEKELHTLKLNEKSIENKNLQNQIELASQQRRIDRLVILIVATALLSIIAVALLIYRSYRQTSMNNRKLMAENEAANLQNHIIELQNEELNLINQDNNKLFSIIGHDLRSPFASIESTLALFKSGDLDKEDLLALSEKLSAQLNTASGMLNSLLMWSANQMGRISFKPVKVDLTMKVEKSINVSLPAASYKNISIHHDKPAVPAITGDADQIRIMIQNLISNAIKFTRAHGTIKIYYEVTTVYLDLVIEDNGIGMTAEKLNHLLTGNSQQSSSYGTGNEKGIGLGLHLVRDFAANNGVILLGESEVDKGTKFILRFSYGIDGYCQSQQTAPGTPH